MIKRVEAYNQLSSLAARPENEWKYKWINYVLRTNTHTHAEPFFSGGNLELFNLLPNVFNRHH